MQERHNSIANALGYIFLALTHQYIKQEGFLHTDTADRCNIFMMFE